MFKKTLSGLMALLIIVAMAISVFGTIVFAADYATYDLALTIDKATGNAVLKVTLPAGVASGKIVVQTTDKLTLVDGSLASSISETKYEDYDRDGIEGLSVTFAKNGTYDAGTEVLTVSFTVNCAADAVTVDDFNAVLWNLSNGSVRLATDADGDVNKTITVIENYTVTFTVSNGGSLVGDTEISVPAGTDIDSILPTVENGGLVIDAGYAYKAYTVTEGELADNAVAGDLTVNIELYLIGDVNYDGYADNLDAAIILRYDALLVDFDDDQKIIGDVTFDGLVDSLDAANILKYDAGIIGPFVRP